MPLYEHSAWHSMPEQVMRPGGMEITERALAFCDLRDGASVLDVGCGIGAALNEIGAGRDWKRFGVDVSAVLLRQACHNCPGACFAQAHGERLPFAGESLDAIIAECTLSLMNTELILRECARMLNHGGYLVVNDLYARNASGIGALRQLPPGTCIGSAMLREEILEKFNRCGFRLIWWQDCSDKLKEFPVCTLATAAAVDPLDLYIAAARAKLGYYFLVAQKDEHDHLKT